MSLKEWLDQRAVLNHDILCNQLRNELGAVRADPKRHALVRLKMWPLHEIEYRRLFDATIEVLSPVRLLDLPVFACWSDDMKTSFRPVFHELFLATTQVEAKVKALHELLGRGVEGVQAFVATPPGKRTTEQAVTLQELLDSLSAAISALPREVGGGV